MTEPTLEQLRAHNQLFFAVTKGGPDRMQVIVKERNNWVLKVVTASNTRPVYLITPELKLVFERHD